MKNFGLLIILLSSSIIFSQTLLLEENFNYSGNLTDNGWTANNGAGTNPINTTTGLSYTGYLSSGIGNAALVNNIGEDVYLPLNSAQTASFVYVSLLVNASNATTASGGDYFFGLGSTNAGTVAGRLYLLRSGSNFAFGISKTAGTTTFTNFDYTFNTTYLIVIKYIINIGASNDDVALFIFSGTIPETEPTATITQPTESSNDPSNISVVALRQNSTTNVVTVDGIRVSDSWSQAPLPVELSSFSATTVGSTVKLNWATATEINNYGFAIHRQIHTSTPLSMTGWEKIGFVNGNGNSNSPKSYSYEDKNVIAGKYSYRLKQIDNDGQFEYSKRIEVDFGAPKKFELSQNYPNPFNPITTIRFNLPEAGNVKLTLFNVLGQEIKTLVNEFKESGVHTINFSATDGASELNSGMYLYKIEAGTFIQTRKMTLIK